MQDEHFKTLPPLMPYMLQALYNWMLDSGFTPHVIVNTNYKEVKVPAKYTQNNKIVLNIAKEATRKILFDNDALEFDACFDGAVEHLYIPVYAIIAIYAKENGAGTVFPEDERERLHNLYKAEAKSGPSLKVINNRARGKKSPKSSPKTLKTKSKISVRQHSTTKLTIIDGGNN